MLEKTTEPLKIIILQEEIAKLDFLRDLFNASGYTLKKTHLTGEDAMKILDKSASQLAVLDIRIIANGSDLEIDSFSSPKVRKIKKAQDSIFSLDSRIEKSTYKNNPELQADQNVSAKTSSSQNLMKQKDTTPPSHGLVFKESLFIRSNSLLVKLRFEDIIYLEADANYTQVFTTDKKYIIRSSMKDLQDKLDDKRFARVHKSFLVNLEKIESIQAESIQIEGKEIPIGRPQYSWLLRQIKVL
ncbi:DNA-binding response regulator, LytR/AlgR family [Algoriphagus alkaliphilus]|uniref:DNA-binding response regulator, LytR/AlgR family n=1 Tax=Algoriphagus alkaliphilus TaxID=279824 RepID=A0A1G5YFL2_9BACT|nr:LytTR family DNA-binding domain-containing protein [Algoriphagus alkaliphilus]MBA4298533.1 LytTR family transcriptional regulator [Cyclobacterium sp.]SDA81054.1 DNA-binding response regulator, LytR/AlgR family [Algoriphagus alkaliphilus]